MQIRDPLPDWSEPETVRAWADLFSPRLDDPLDAWIQCHVHPDVVSAVARFLLPAFVEHDGGVFLRDGFSLEGHAQWKAKLGQTAAVECMLNHQHVTDCFDVADGATDQTFAAIARLMAQSLRIALHFSFPGRRFHVFVNTGEEHDPVVGFHSGDAPHPMVESV